MFDKPSICAKCGGKCCKQSPGATVPADFGLPGVDGEQRVKDAIATGRYCIDWWDDDVRGGVYSDWKHPDHRARSFYIRASIKGKEHQLTDDTSYGGMCTFWELGKGCTLASDARPYECRMLEPGDADDGTQCKSHTGGNRRVMATEWLPYDKLFRELLKGEE